MARKMLVDGKPVDFDSLFEDDDSMQPQSDSESRKALDLSNFSMNESMKESMKESMDELMRQESGAESNASTLRPGQAIDVEVISIGSENILFVGKAGESSSGGLTVGRLEGVVSKDDYSASELAEMHTGTSLRVFVVSASRKGNLISVEASRESRNVTASGSGLDALREAYAEHLPVTGKVTGENKGGYEVALQGAKGFVPFSQMDITPGRKDSSQFIGQTFQFEVTRIEGRNVVLSRAALLRAEQAANQERIMASIEPGVMIQATVQKTESFGLFVDLGSGISALVPQSEIAWSRGQVSLCRYSAGDKVMVKVLKVESLRGRPRISASIKQADADPWDTLPENIAPGRELPGQVTRLVEFGAFVELAPGIEALLHISEMSSKKRVYRSSDVVQAEQQINVRILSVDRINKRISVTLKEPAKDSGKGVSSENEDIPDSISIPSKSGGGSALAAALMKASKK